MLYVTSEGLSRIHDPYTAGLLHKGVDTRWSPHPKQVMSEITAPT